MIATTPTADALLIPERYKVGATQRERIASINRIAYPLLGVDNARDEDAWIRNRPVEGGRLFVTKDGDDLIYFPATHPMRGRPRYEWVEDADGVRRGYLTPEARADEETRRAD